VVDIAVITQVAVEENPLLKAPFFRQYFALPEEARAPQQRRASAAGSAVEMNSTAERTGLNAGDAIIAIDGRAVQRASDVRNRIGLREAGSIVTISYLRGGKRQTVTFLIAELQ
jgi:S1-C subfamily serine protease